MARLTGEQLWLFGADLFDGFDRCGDPVKLTRAFSHVNDPQTLLPEMAKIAMTTLVRRHLELEDKLRELDTVFARMASPERREPGGWRPLQTSK